MGLKEAKEFTFDLYVIHQMLQEGWRPVAIHCVPACDPKTGDPIKGGIQVDFVAIKNVEGIGLVKAYVKAYNKFH